MDEAGNEVDPSGYALRPEGYGDDDYADDYDARLAELEQRMAQPPPPPFDHEQARARASDEQHADAVTREIENLETTLGRKLSDREAWALLEDHNADYSAGVQPDVWKSAATAGIADTSTHEGRVARAMDSIADSERAQAGEGYDPDQREWHEPASSSPSDVRVARAQNFVDHGITSAEQAEQDSYLNEED